MTTGTTAPGPTGSAAAAAATDVVVVAAGTVTSTLVTEPVVMDVAMLPAESSTANDSDALSITVPEEPAASETVAETVQREGLVCTTESIREMFVSPKSDEVTVEQSIGSLPESVKATVDPDTFADTAASVSTGAVTSAMVTTTDAGEPEEMDVAALPYSSSTENPDDARRELVPDDPGATDDVAEMVHLVGVVWVTESTWSTAVRTKSADVTVLQSTASFPVSVNDRFCEDDVADTAASTSTGAVVSAMTNVRSRVAAEYVSVWAALARTTQFPSPENVSVRAPEFTVHDDAVVDITEYEIAPSPDVVAAANTSGDDVRSRPSTGLHETACDAREIVKVRSTDADAYDAVAADVARTTQFPSPENVSVRAPEFTVHDDAVVDTTEYEIAPELFVVAAAKTAGESVVDRPVDGFHVTVASFRYGAAHRMMTAPLPPAAPKPGAAFCGFLPPPPPPPPRPFVPAAATRGAGYDWFHELSRVLVPHPEPVAGFQLSQFSPGTMSLPPPPPLPYASAVPVMDDK